MYALSNTKTQPKLLVKVRGGLSQKFESSNSNRPKFNKSDASNRCVQKTADGVLSGFEACFDLLPQPIFKSSNLNENEKFHPTQKASKKEASHKHDEMINYVRQSWKVVEHDYEKSVSGYAHPSLDTNRQTLPGKNNRKAGSIASPLLLSGSYHHISGKGASLSDHLEPFKPFDLYAFWENRVFKNLTQTDT